MAAESNKFSAFHERAFRSIYSEVLLAAQHAPRPSGPRQKCCAPPKARTQDTLNDTIAEAKASVTSADTKSWFAFCGCIIV